MDAEIFMTDGFSNTKTLVAAGKSLFLTGKAGTGKSTLLRIVVKDALLRGAAVQVVAPTGVAALNVDGQTIHKLFGFHSEVGRGLTNYRPPTVLVELDLLVIDEISMARADLVDMMDLALRRARRSNKPFGGLQILMVGDLFQLPPVVSNHESSVELDGYSTPFFFSAKALNSLRFETVELLEVFRQTEQDFIGLLNSIRDGSAGEEEISLLNGLVVLDTSGEEFANHITLTTTNRVAEQINLQRLDALGGKRYYSQATYGGDFDAHSYKVDIELEFAVGAQVMFVVNGDGFVNGSLGHVVAVTEDTRLGSVASIRLSDNGTVLKVSRHRWSILVSKKTKDGVGYEEVGFFEQLPFKLAWAVTVHKSQGKTFDRVIFDRGRQVFAEGQLYVALSRCRTLEGLVLSKPIKLSDVRTSKEVIRFHQSATLGLAPVLRSDMVFVGFVETGGREYSKVVEVAVVDSNTDPIRWFSTLINPLRDLAGARETGVTAETVSAAPSFGDVASLLGEYLDKSVLCGFGLERFMNIAEWPASVTQGRGVDLLDWAKPPAHFANSTALGRAMEAKKAFDGLEQTVLGSPFSKGDLRLAEGYFFLSRRNVGAEAIGEAWVLDEHSDIDPAWIGASDVAEIASGGRFSATVREADEHAAAAVVASLRHSAMRDGQLRSHEKLLIESYCEARGINLPSDSLEGESEAPVVLFAGMKICLTGEPPRGAEHDRLGKSALRKLIEARGIEEVRSVTKSKCDLVVAFNASSMSGKAKRARELEKPVMGAEEFFSLITEWKG